MGYFLLAAYQYLASWGRSTALFYIYDISLCTFTEDAFCRGSTTFGSMQALLKGSSNCSYGNWRLTM